MTTLLLPAYCQTPHLAQISAVHWHKFDYRSKYFSRATIGDRVVSVDFTPDDVDAFKAAGHDTSVWENIPRNRKLERPILVLAEHETGSAWRLLGVLPVGCDDPKQAVMTSAAAPDIQKLAADNLPQSLIVTTYTPADKNYRGNAVVVKATSGSAQYEGKDTPYDEFHARLVAFGYKLEHEEFAVTRRVYWGGKPMSRTKIHVYDLIPPVLAAPVPTPIRPIPDWLRERETIPVELKF